MVVEEAKAVMLRAVENSCRGGQGSPRAGMLRAVENGCRGGIGSPGL
jgi:hypothetical protein